MSTVDNLTKMRQSAANLAPNNRFTARVFRTKGGRGTEEIMFNCYRASVPGRLINTTSHKHYGLPRLIAGSVSFAPVTLGFYLSNNHAEREYFLNWMEEIVPVNASGGNSKPAYYDDYIAQIVVRQQNNNGYEGPKYTIEEAYPFSVTNIEYEFTTKEILKFEVQFNYYKII